MKKSHIVYSHLIFWLFQLVIMYFPAISGLFIGPGDFGKIHLISVYFTPAFFYLGYLCIMFLVKNLKYTLYIIFTFIICFLILFLTSKEIFAFAILLFTNMLSWAAIGALFKFFISWFQKRNLNLTLAKQKLESNLALLRTQINPHFLFNTLHNIDSLIKVDQGKASESLIQLSDIMRYMLDDSSSKEVTLIDELNYLENYISLEKLRLKNPEYFSFKINGNPEGHLVAPMLFLPFIENAFKHSVDSDIANGISIKFDLKPGRILFHCENIFDDSGAEKDSTHGIGLETVKERLSLLYPKNHHLEIEKNNISFIVELQLMKHEN